MDWRLVLAGALVGIVVGLTGMGGGALMTPILVLFFGVQPLAAVSTDLVVSLLMKPVGAAVHLHRRTVDLTLVRLLCYGSVPAAFCSVLLLRLVPGPALQSVVRVGLGVMLIVAASAMIVKGLVASRRTPPEQEAVPPVPRRVPTVAAGAVVGSAVGVTSVGSGSLVIVSLMMLYPSLSVHRLVGTDLVQAIPLVGAAALGHLLFGDIQLTVTVALLLGALPAVYLGARLSSTAPAGLIRYCLVVVLLLSALKLLGAPDVVLLLTLVAAVGVSLLRSPILRSGINGVRPS